MAFNNTGNRPVGPFTMAANQGAPGQAPAAGGAGVGGFSIGTGTGGTQPAFNFGGGGALGGSTATTQAQLSFATTTTTSAGLPFTLGGLATAAPSTGSGGTATGFSFGTPASTATTSVASAMKPISFGAPATPKTVTFSLPSSVPSAATPAVAVGSTGFTFGTGASASNASATANPATTTTAGFSSGTSAGATTATTSAASSLGAGSAGGAGDASSVATAPGAADGTMNFRQLQETLNKMMLEIQAEEKIFMQQATKINAWDRTLLANGEKIGKLNESVVQVKKDSIRVEHALEFLKMQQREFELFLQPLEASLPANVPVEPEREELFNMTESLDTQLNQMGEDLKNVILTINETNKTVDGTDPVAKILRILNEHTDTLQWVEDQITLVHRNLEDVSKQHVTSKKDHENAMRQMFK